MKVSIIGTAGRSNAAHLNSTLFDRAFDAVYNLLVDYLEDYLNEGIDITLVSGGSAWADHIAVMLFLDDRNKFSKLKLYVPSPFEGDSFKDSGVVDWRTNPGGTLNYYHSLFSKKMETNTLLDIKKAIEYGAEIDSSHKSFHSRNTKVAQSDVVIALTFGVNEPEDGGTLDPLSQREGGKKYRIPAPNSIFH